MRLDFQLLMFLCINTMLIYGQNEQQRSLNFGDPAPSLYVREWLKGKPVKQFEKGKIYVLEFWATWCKPCKAAMPRLSKLAQEYKKKITVIGVDVYETKTTPINKIRDFVDSMGNQMKYIVALEDSNFMEVAWLNASGERGIPTAFVVNAEGRLAWFGHPMHLHEALPKIVNNTWNANDINELLAKQHSDNCLKEQDDSLNYDLMNYKGKDGDWYGEPDSVIFKIDEMIKNEPELKFAPMVAFNTFVALLKIDLHRAHEYGKEVLRSPTYDEPAANGIIYAIEWYSDKLTLPAEIYELGAEAYEVKINQMPYPELANMFKFYNKMAEWYWRGGNKSKAIYAQKKAIKALKRK